MEDFESEEFFAGNLRLKKMGEILTHIFGEGNYKGVVCRDLCKLTTPRPLTAEDLELIREYASHHCSDLRRELIRRTWEDKRCSIHPMRAVTESSPYSQSQSDPPAQEASSNATISQRPSMGNLARGQDDTIHAEATLYSMPLYLLVPERPDLDVSGKQCSLLLDLSSKHGQQRQGQRLSAQPGTRVQNKPATRRFIRRLVVSFLTIAIFVTAWLLVRIGSTDLQNAFVATIIATASFMIVSAILQLLEKQDVW